MLAVTVVMLEDELEDELDELIVVKYHISKSIKILIKIYPFFL